MRMSLALAAVVLLVLPLDAKRQPRDWQDATVLEVQRPAQRGTQGAPTNPVGTATQMNSPTPSVPMLESTGRGETWAYFTGRKSFLGALQAGKPVKAFIDRRSLYLLDPKGKEWKLRLLTPGR